MKLFMKVALLLVLLFGFTACNQTDENTETKSKQGAKINTASTYDQTPAKRAEKIVKKRDEVTEAVAFNTNKQMLLTFNVKQFDRFQLKRHEKEIKQQLQKEFPKKEINVTTDSKITQQIGEVKSKIKMGTMSSKKLDKEMMRLIKLMNEET
ncbi:YhcN/YlaJ family sporulation lipoprotein [Pseudalkalibacillus caeni]|nr:YhcN/YlaJ family sporulation lipoprotein [Pseudalkalibacillus caeni]